MNKEFIFECLKKQKGILEKDNYKVAYICVYGSQNYGLDLYTDEYQSDLDMKAVIIPELDDLIYNCKPLSFVIDTEWGQCDVKDIRIYTESLCKMNPAYVETLYTEYFIIDEEFRDDFKDIFDHADALVDSLKFKFSKAIYGMSLEKQKALCHPYPSTADKIEKYGYDPKQLSHCSRLNFLMKDYFVYSKSLKDCFKLLDRDFEITMNQKLGMSTLEEAKIICNDTVQENKKLCDKVCEEFGGEKANYKVAELIVEFSRKIIRKYIVRRIRQ